MTRKENNTLKEAKLIILGNIKHSRRCYYGINGAPNMQMEDCDCWVVNAVYIIEELIKECKRGKKH